MGELGELGEMGSWEEIKSNSAPLPPSPLAPSPYLCESKQRVIL